MRFTILTLFPEMVAPPLAHSMVGRARAKGLLEVAVVGLRPYGVGRHHQVDDTPYGGGPGMVLKADVLADALDALPDDAVGARPLVVLLTPQGEPFTQAVAGELAQRDHVVLVCGHYEGVDERFVAQRVARELSVGDFVLTGGEIAALAVVDATARLVPGVLGDAESAQQESFQGSLLDCPHYTRPSVWAGSGVPAVLTSGDHGAVAAWRRREALLRTVIRRPDLLAGAHLTKTERVAVERLLQAMREQLPE